jgi:hypothetical protein
MKNPRQSVVVGIFFFSTTIQIQAKSIFEVDALIPSN